jgi:hypothetical protein
MPHHPDSVRRLDFTGKPPNASMPGCNGMPTAGLTPVLHDLPGRGHTPMEVSVAVFRYRP